MNFKGKDDRLCCLEAYLTLTCLKNSRLTGGKIFHFNESIGLTKQFSDLYRA